MTISDKVGVVIIGRNEGKRLILCIQSILKDTTKIVYVDSGSTDDSVNAAIALNVEVVSLDLTTPFTAARARNAGLNRLLECYPSLAFVQFVDGDCEVFAKWLENCLAFIQNNPNVVAVCGRRKERYPSQSIYNYACDIEWNTPLGEAKACGGDAMFRVNALLKVGGYNDQLIAGEEPELCLRLRRAGGEIWRIDHDMTLHDAALHFFSQWWKRNVRAGHAYAEGAYMYGFAPERHWVKEVLRAIFWAALLPLFIIFMTFYVHKHWIALILIYVLFYIKIVVSKRTLKHPFKYALLLKISKFAEFVGIMTFIKRRLSHSRIRLIEYK